jgi:radical SAM/SPASM domain protein of ACGX system
MPLQRMKDVISNCEDMCEKLNRTPYFYITGGDPILHPDFWTLTDILKEKGYKFTIMGNPFHLNDDVCRRLKECGCQKYQLSIDGMRETHDMFRKKGSFDCTIRAIKYIRDSGMKCAIMSTVSDVNIDEMSDVCDLVVENNVDIFAFGRYCPTGEEKKNAIKPLEYRAFLDKLWKKYEEYKKKGVNTYFNLKDHLWTLYLYEEGIFKIPENADKNMIYDGCHCGVCHMTILPNGDVYACRRFESKVGNVFDEKLYDIFVSKEEIYRDFDKFEKCSKCELKGFCRGCPAVSYGTHGSFYATDPQCWKEL